MNAPGITPNQYLQSSQFSLHVKSDIFLLSDSLSMVTLILNYYFFNKNLPFITQIKLTVFHETLCVDT